MSAREMGIADHHADGFVHATTEFLDQKRQAQGRVQVARDLEQARVAAVEEDRNHRRPAFLDHLRREAAPDRIERLRKGFGRGRDRTARKDPDGTALPQIAQRLGARGEVRLDRGPAFGEVDRQDNPVKVWGIAKDAIGQDAEVTRPETAQDVAHHQAVEDAVGMVRHHDERAVLRDEVERSSDDLEREAIAADHLLPEVAIPGDRLVIPVGAADQAQASRGVFDRPDQRASAAAAGREGIAYVAGDLSLHQRIPVPGACLSAAPEFHELS